MSAQLRDDALRIWHAGVDAVDSQRLVQDALAFHGSSLTVAGTDFPLHSRGRICVVGAGKAGAGMAAGVETVFAGIEDERLSGWVNVPDDCVRELKHIHLHAARPAAFNEPTFEGVAGARKILDCVASLTQDDVCLVLISGGGSALLPAPIEGITLADKQQVTRALMRSGATIQELNLVRRSLSQIKGGGLLRSCRAGRLIALIISDVIGDSLDVIASGPTVDCPLAPDAALQLLRRFQQDHSIDIPDAVITTLERMSATSAEMPPIAIPYTNHIIGNNATAVAAASREAQSLGYQVVEAVSDRPGIAREIGVELARRCRQLSAASQHSGKRCLISGGEPTVVLAKTGGPQKGGRNQELVLAAGIELEQHSAQGIVILSGGTDGEDGPTDAAGAVIDWELMLLAEQRRLDAAAYLAANNSYPFFDQIDGLIRTGPTHTNVMDVRVCLIDR